MLVYILEIQEVVASNAHRVDIDMHDWNER